MAGQWIPWSIGLQQKPEVIRMAKACNVSANEMAARCMIVWAWGQDQTEDGFIAGLTPADVSAAVGIPGVGEAMASVDWLLTLEDGIAFPNWERFNGRPSKKRMKAAERKRRQLLAELPEGHLVEGDDAVGGRRIGEHVARQDVLLLGDLTQ